MRFSPIITALTLTVPLIALGAPAQAAAPTCAGERATVVGNGKANNLSGTTKRDVIWAGDGNDTISRTRRQRPDLRGRWRRPDLGRT